MIKVEVKIADVSAWPSKAHDIVLGKFKRATRRMLRDLDRNVTVTFVETEDRIISAEGHDIELIMQAIRGMRKISEKF